MANPSRRVRMCSAPTIHMGFAFAKRAVRKRKHRPGKQAPLAICASERGIAANAGLLITPQHPETHRGRAED